MSATGPVVGGGPARRLGRAALRWFSRSWGIIAVVVAWQLWATISGYNRIVVPTPVEVAGDLLRHPGIYAGDTLSTSIMGVLGLAIGMALGFALGVAVWFSPFAAGVVGPVALVVRSIPIITILPVLAQVVGYGNKLVPIVTALLAFFPAFVMTGAGLRSAPPASADMMRSLGASRVQVLRRVLVPAAVPSLCVALRLAAATCVLGAVLAEFLAGTRGLGDLFSDARIRFEMQRAWGAALIATVLSVALFLGASRLERWADHRYRNT